MTKTNQAPVAISRLFLSLFLSLPLHIGELKESTYLIFKGIGTKKIKFINCFMFHYQTNVLQIKPTLENSGFPVDINITKESDTIHH